MSRDSKLSESADARSGETPAGISAQIPLAARLGHEIPKPKDWQALQRGCVVLFRDELNDPNTTEFGRGGQDQKGIDILGRRGGKPDQLVGIQCRLVQKPLKESKILEDCRAALGIEAGLKEIIFATTAPDDVGATEACLAVEKKLREEGHELVVAIFGWPAMQNLIALHPQAYDAFCPWMFAAAPLKIQLPTEDKVDIARLVAETLQQSGVLPLSAKDSLPRPTEGGHEFSSEDPVLHAKIDTLRDVFRKHGSAAFAREELRKLAENGLERKPGARYRIETILASISIDLGEEQEAARRFQIAFGLRPNDPNACANLALARIIQGRPEEAMQLAQQALGMQPRPEAAVGYLLQAAARSSWSGDPEALIPEDLIGSEAADIGLADFVRRRNTSGWPERAIKLAARHPNCTALKHIGAVAVLELALEGETYLVGGASKVSQTEIAVAAEDMYSVAKSSLSSGFADERDLVAQVNNASVLLRFANRTRDCESLIREALPKTNNASVLRRILALTLYNSGRSNEAVSLLREEPLDPENILMAAEFDSDANPASALASIESLGTEVLDATHRWVRLLLMAEIGLKTKNFEIVRQAIQGLRTEAPPFGTPDLLEVRLLEIEGDKENEIRERLHSLASQLPADASAPARFQLALALNHADLHEDASRVLEGHIDFTRANMTAELYLESLAGARRDAAFASAIRLASDDLLRAPNVIWTRVSHAWNTGDIPAALALIEDGLKRDSQNSRLRLLKVEALIRLNRLPELKAELQKPIEELHWKRLQDRFRIVALLAHFGFWERAATLAYRLFLEHRDLSQAWMTLTLIVLSDHQQSDELKAAWTPTEVGEDTAVVLKFDDGQEQLIIVEPDEELRKFDGESWEPDHELIRAIAKLREGDRFRTSDGREGLVISVKHKYVARAQFAMSHHQARFPTVFGIRKVEFDPEKPGGLDQVKALLQEQKEWINSECDRYLNGPLPLGVFASRIGKDVIDCAASIGSSGRRLKVATGTREERRLARAEIRDNERRGCALDLLSFWNAWRLGAIEALVNVCGRPHLPRTAFDRLLMKRDELKGFMLDGRLSMHAEGEGLAARLVTQDEIKSHIEDLNRAIAWVEGNAVIAPVIAEDSIPQTVRAMLRGEKGDFLDVLVVAHQANVVLVSEDLPSRQLAKSVFGSGGVWLHEVLGVASEENCISAEQYTRWTADLIDAGQSHLATNATMLCKALHMDLAAGKAPGYVFNAIASSIGGALAEIRSHAMVCAEFINLSWPDLALSSCYKQATGILLLNLVRSRTSDFHYALSAVANDVLKPFPQNVAIQYIKDWMHGHFLADPFERKRKRP